ncbi:MAG: S8 family serine peptidase [Steroidobacteraceae bacterium]
MSQTITRVSAITAVMMLAGIAAGAAPQSQPKAITPLTPAPAPDNTIRYEGTNLWFVELRSSPAVKGTSMARLNSEKRAFRQAAADADVSYKERFAFSKLWNGLSIQVDSAGLSTISRLPGVKAIYPVGVIPVPEISGVSPDLETALAMTGADIAQSELGFDGTGIKVAVMDTGLDYDHGDLGGDGVQRTNSNVFPTSRVVAGFDLVGDSYNASSISPNFQPVPQPDPFPDDCNGHGTHVSGIVGADGNFAAGGARGVAPGVTFGAYRVFGCDGSTTDDVMIAAMERVLADGMDVLNMSIGDAFNNWPGTPTAVASDNLVDAGVVVVASIGNSGASGVWSAGAPGVGNKVTGVASYDNSHVEFPYFTVNDRNVGYAAMTFSPAAPTSGTEEIVNIGRACTATLGDTLLADPAGKVALAARGDCSFNEKATAAINADAVAVVISNNIPGVVLGTLGAPIDDVTPVVGISLADGDFIRAQPAPVLMTWTDQTDIFVNPSGGLISSFSSYGTAAELEVKPDIGAPGGLIRSTVPLEAGGYDTISGTSMASPHVAGAAALLLESKGWASPTPAQAAAVRGLLQNSAVPAPWQGNPGLGFLDQVHRQGAGMLRIDRAIEAPVSVTPGKLQQGEAGAALTHTLTLANHTGADITYDLSHQAALSTFGSTFAPSATTSGAANGGPITFNAASVLVPSGGTATVDVTIPRPNFGAANKVVYGGYIRFTPQGGGQVLRVPYAGFGGDYQGFPILTGGGSTPPFPKLATWTGFVSADNFTPTFTFPASPVTYTMEKTNEFGRLFADIPTLAVHLDHQARFVRVTVLDSAGNPVVSNSPSQTLDPVAIDADFFPRNSTAGGFFAFSWDGRLMATLPNGKVSSKNMPNGDYQLRVEVLKPLGSEPVDVETFTSPTFTIARPE